MVARTLFMSCGLAALSLASAAQAQDQEQTPPDDGIADIVVTAQKRTENAQNVPVSVTALNSEAISARHGTDITALSGLAPNVRIEPLGIASTSAFFIRGTGTADPDASFDSAVGMVIDGVFVARTLGAVIDTADVESIEILRGPQGTLFGKNTTGGLINVTYRRPGMDFGGNAGLRIGNYDAIELKAALDIPIIADTLAVRASGQLGRRDGYFRSTIDGARVGAQRTEGARLVFLLRPSGSPYDASLTLDYHNDHSDGPTSDNNATPGRNYALCDGFGLCGDGSYTTISNGLVTDRVNVDTYMAALTQNLELGDHTLTSVTGYRRLTSDVPLDVDSTPGRFIDIQRGETTTQFSQELRISSPTSGAITYVAGLFYFHQKANTYSYYDFADLLGATFPFLQTTRTYGYANLTTRNYAAFAQADFHLSDQAWVTLGGRYSIEKKRVSQTWMGDVATAIQANALLPDHLPPEYENSLTSRNFSPRVVANFKPTENTLLFASWTRGFRSGGFNSRATSLPEALPFDDERVDSFELGFKSDLLDRRLRVNATLFMSKTDNLQAEQVFPGLNNVPATATLNAGSATSKGIELEIVAQPVRGLRFDFTAAYIHARYDDFCADISRGIHADAVGLGVTGCSAAIPTATDNTDLRLKSIPAWSGNASVEYDWELANASSITLRADVTYSSRSYQDIQNSDLGIRRASAIVGSSIKWSDADERYSISVYGRNLTNRRYIEGFNPGATTPLAWYNAPRTFGVELGVKF